MEDGGNATDLGHFRDQFFAMYVHASSDYIFFVLFLQDATRAGAPLCRELTGGAQRPIADHIKVSGIQ